MTTSNAAPKGNIPVLVYLGSEPLSLSCSMRILYRGRCKQMTIAVRISVALDGSEADQTFVAQYDADNLTITLDATTVHIPHARLGDIARSTNCRIKTLSLKLKQPCPLWYPRLDRLAPKPQPSSVVSFNELVRLAKAMEVHIVFDYNRLREDLHVPLGRAAKGKEKLTGYPCEDYYAGNWKLKDWTIFGPTDTAAAPPTYADASNKRARPDSSSASSSPPSKRVILEQSRLQAQRFSSTEPFTSSSADECSPKTHPNDDGDFQTWAISQVVKRECPVILRQVLSELLPNLVPTMFALPPWYSSSPEGSNSDSDSSQTSQLPKLTPLGATFVPYLLAHIQPQLQKMLTKAFSYEEHQRQSACLDFENEIEDHKAEMNLIKEDGIEALQREAGYALDEAREQGKNFTEELDEDVDAVRDKGKEVIEAVHWTLKTMKEETLKDVAVEWLVAREMRKYENSAIVADWRHSKWMRGRWRRGAGKGGYRGLGERWRKATPLP